MMTGTYKYYYPSGSVWRICNYTNNKLLRLFFKKLDTDLLWGLYKRKLIINLPLPNFDWFDAYFMIRVLNDYKFITINTTDPKWFRGIYGTYIVKPLFSSYLQPGKYFFRALPYAIKSGGLSILYHMKTVLKSYLYNFRIFKKKLQTTQLIFIYLCFISNTF